MRFELSWSGIPALLLTLLPDLAVGQANYTPYTFTTLAGTASTGSADGVGPAARFDAPRSLAADAVGNLYVADEANHTV